MNVGSLFSGVGGIELGLQRAGGFETKWFVEWEPYAQAVLRKHWPGKPVYGDITTIDWSTVEPVDVLTGGFPCQDASIANPNGKGIAGARTGLWKHYLEAIRQLRPKFIIAENVPNLLNQGFEQVIEDLASVGYDAEWDVVCYELVIEEGQLFMQRERLVTIAYPNSTGGEGLLPQQTSIENDEHLALARSLLARRELQLSEPALLGMGTRFPKRLDRTRCCGNAVSPRMSEALATLIKRGATLNNDRTEAKASGVETLRTPPTTEVVGIRAGDFL